LYDNGTLWIAATESQISQVWNTYSEEYSGMGLKGKIESRQNQN